jgi:hypothetical protein
VCCPEEELASSEESGKDWSDLEREAAEADKERSDFQDEYAGSDKKGKGKRPASYGGRKGSDQNRLVFQEEVPSIFTCSKLFLWMWQAQMYNNHVL